MLSYIIESYFKQAASTKDSLESQILAQALHGPQGLAYEVDGEDANGFSSVVDYAAQGVGRAEEDAPKKVDVFTYQIKGSKDGEEELGSVPDEIVQERRKNYQLRIQNIGLALVIISKN